MTDRMPSGAPLPGAGEGGVPRPDWMATALAALEAGDNPLGRFAPPAEGGRQSAVLMLFGPGEDGGQDVLLTERAHDMRSHPGQVSFPGGALEPDDDGPVAAALREAEEEVGLDPASVDVVSAFPPLFLQPSEFVVTPVLAWWPRPHEVRVVDRREVERVARVPLAALLDPARRFTVTHPSGYRGGAFDASDLFVWGFTAGLLDGVLSMAGLAVPWDESVSRELPERFSRPWRSRA